MSHSVLAPSSAAVWGRPDGCPGSVRLKLETEVDPNEDRSAADEGTAAHEVAAILAKGEKHPKELLGSTAENGVMITQEMLDAALEYSAYVRGVRIANGGFEISTEMQIQIPAVHSECFGTVDCFGTTNDGTLHVFDFKYGFGFVDAYENRQLLCYASGIVSLRQPKQIVLHIIQPRSYHPEGTKRLWVLSLKQFRKYERELSDAAHIALGPQPITRTGDHCKYCEARYLCKAAIAAALTYYEIVDECTPVEMSNDAMGLQLLIVQRAKRQIEYLETAYAERLKSKIREGESVASWRMAEKTGNLAWDIPYDQIVDLGKSVGKDLAQKKPLTPKQAIDAGVSEEMVKALSSRKTGAMALEYDDGSKAKRIFES